jgi:hypothetical protein
VPLTVDVDPLHLREIQHQSAVADAPSGYVVAAPAHRDLELVLTREAHAMRHIIGIGTSDDQPRSLINQSVPDPAGFVVPAIARTQKLTPQVLIESRDCRVVDRCAGLRDN